MEVLPQDESDRPETTASLDYQAEKLERLSPDRGIGSSVEAFITRSDRADRFGRLIVCYFPDLSERMPGDRYRALQEESPVVVPIENPAPDISDLSLQHSP
jgi:hypothetical protein